MSSPGTGGHVAWSRRGYPRGVARSGAGGRVGHGQFPEVAKAMEGQVVGVVLARGACRARVTYAVRETTIISSPSNSQSTYWNPCRAGSGWYRMIQRIVQSRRFVEHINAKAFRTRPGLVLLCFGRTGLANVQYRSETGSWRMVNFLVPPGKSMKSVSDRRSRVGRRH